MSEKVLNKYEITNKELVYDGFSKIEKLTISDGDKEYHREVFKYGNTVSAIIKDTVKNKYIFVEQYRPATDGLMVEVVSGMIDEGEKPEQAIKREIMEETGYKVDYTDHIADFYTTPGKCDEICSLFYVEVSEQIHEGGGIGDENINVIEVEKLGLNGKIFPKDPFAPIEEGEETKIIPPYQLIDARSIIAVSYVENSNTLKGMSDVITQAKLRSL
jgi:nudix-type nucleoside diphosphatase (YffH/AdpP family)